MEMSIELDHARRRINLVVAGPFNVEKMRDLMMSRPRDDTWGYGVLFDIRGMTGVPSIRDVRELSPSPKDTSQAGRGPIALLVTDTAQYNLACAYVAMAGRTRLAQVFHDRREAEDWLATRRV
jgi:hypothetical protein